MAAEQGDASASEPRWVPAGPGGDGGWDCHTFPDGESFALICLADDCPDKDKRNLQRFAGEVLFGVELD
jgi:hypothetical protein